MHMFVSAMQRPQQTALPLARALGCAVRVRDDLHEIAMTFTARSARTAIQKGLEYLSRYGIR